MSERNKRKRERETRTPIVSQHVDGQQAPASQDAIPVASGTPPSGSADEAWLRFAAGRAEDADRKQEERNRATWMQLLKDRDRRARTMSRAVLGAFVTTLLIALASIVIALVSRKDVEDIPDIQSRISRAEAAISRAPTAVPAPVVALASPRLDLDYSPMSETGLFVVVARTNPPTSGQQLRAQLLPANSGEISAPPSATDEFGATMIEVRARLDFVGLMRVQVQRASDGISQTASILVRRPPKPAAAPSVIMTSTSTGPQSAGIDTDGDGIPDAEEARLQTSATLTDTDGDGLSDWLEREIGSSPIVTDVILTTGTAKNGAELGFLRTDPSDDDATRIATIPGGLGLVKLGAPVSSTNLRQKVAILMWIDSKDDTGITGAKPSWSGVSIFGSPSAQAPVIGFRADVALDIGKVRWDKAGVNGRLLVAIVGYYPTAFIK